MAEKRPVFVGWVFQCPPCTLAPQLVTQHSEGYQTVTHADAISSAGFAGDNRLRADAEFTLFYLGPVRIKGTLGLDFEVGAFSRVWNLDDKMESDILQAGGPGQAPKAQPGSCGS